MYYEPLTQVPAQAQGAQLYSLMGCCRNQWQPGTRRRRHSGLRACWAGALAYCSLTASALRRAAMAAACVGCGEAGAAGGAFVRGAGEVHAVVTVG